MLIAQEAIPVAIPIDPAIMVKYALMIACPAIGFMALLAVPIAVMKHVIRKNERRQREERKTRKQAERSSSPPTAR